MARRRMAVKMAKLPAAPFSCYARRGGDHELNSFEAYHLLLRALLTEGARLNAARFRAGSYAQHDRPAACGREGRGRLACPPQRPGPCIAPVSRRVSVIPFGIHRCTIFSKGAIDMISTAFFMPALPVLPPKRILKKWKNASHFCVCFFRRFVYVKRVLYICALIHNDLVNVKTTISYDETATTFTIGTGFRRQAAFARLCGRMRVYNMH